MGRSPCHPTPSNVVNRFACYPNVRIVYPRLNSPFQSRQLPHTTHAIDSIAYSVQEASDSYPQLQHVCKTVLAGVAAAAACSLLASTTGPGTPFASLTLASGSSGASGKQPWLSTWCHTFTQSKGLMLLACCRCYSSSKERMGWACSWFPAYTLWSRPLSGEFSTSVCSSVNQCYG